MPCVDTHCHLQMAQFDGDRETVLEQSLQTLAWLVVVGDDIAGSRAACELIRPNVYAVVGLHPYNAPQMDESAADALRALAQNPHVVGVGETGLDYFNEFAPRVVQRPAFERQLALAKELGLPAVIHSRAAQEDTLAILRNHAPFKNPCIMHCFGGNADFAESCVELGCYISFAGNVTYPKALELQRSVQVTPLDNLLVETDAPYLAPQCQRGKRCEPAFAAHTLAFLATLKNTSVEELGAHSVRNAHRAFPSVPAKMPDQQ